MFFLITHLLIGKYYPSVITQFIIGCTCYILIFFIIKDIINSDCIKQYKYYALSLIAVDASFIVYKTKCQMDSTKPIQPYQSVQLENKTENTSTDLKTGSIHSVTLSSELNDFRITHDLSLSDGDINNNSMFSTSDEKSFQKSDEKSDEKSENKSNEKSKDVNSDPTKLSATSSISINQDFDILK